MLNANKPTLSVSENYEYGIRNPTKYYKSAIPTESFDTVASAYPIKRIDIYEPAVLARSRSYRKATTPETTSQHSTKLTDTLYNLNDLTEKYDSRETTELSNPNITVIPLMSTTIHDSSVLSDVTNSNENVALTASTYNYTEPTEIPKTEEYIIYKTTEKYDSTEVPPPQLITKNISDDPNKLPKANRTFDYIDATSNLDNVLETTTQLAHFLTPLQAQVRTFNLTRQLDVIGIPEIKNMATTNISKVEKFTERILRLHPSKEEKYVQLRETVHNMAENTMLKKETEDYVIQFNRRYQDLPLVEADNKIWRKYSRAVVESFMLDFCRDYPHYYEPQEWLTRSYKVDEYRHYYNMTLLDLRKKKRQSALQFTAPVRKVADMYKAILDTPIGIVQSKCIFKMPRWLCVAEYLVYLAEASETCEHIWHHAHVHLTILQNIRHTKGIKDPTDEVIVELNSRLSAYQRNDSVDYLFDVIVHTLDDLGNRLKDSLLAKANLYNLIRKLLNEDKLKCFSIDNEGL